MTKPFDKVMTGLEDARAYLNGARDGFTVHEVEVPEPNVVAIRGKTGLSQPGLCQKHRRAAGNAQELGAGPAAP